MNERVVIGHNNPPDPIDDATAAYADAIAEAENWLDGQPVSNDDQLSAVEAITKDVKAALKAVTDGEKSAATPLHDAWKAEKARWKPTIDDLTRLKTGLIALVSDFKRAKVEAERAAERKAYAEAEAKRREAVRAAQEANAADIEAQRAAALAQAEAEEAQRQAVAASKNKTKGMRQVHRYEIESHKDALNWIALNDRPALTEYIEEYVRRNHRSGSINGVRVWTEKEAF